MSTTAAPDHCENCTAPLHGAFCHQCGQSMHNPIRHAGHAIEEFFEAFWHLDGRVFRTLRDLLRPGMVAINYLAGHRQRYIAPLRLFVILSLMTFFIGAATVHVEGSAVNFDGQEEIAAATTVEQVEQVRDRVLAELAQARVEAADSPGVEPVLAAAEAGVRQTAAERVAELTGAPPAAAADTAADAAGSAVDDKQLTLNVLGHSGPWHPQTNPVVIGWWPDFANRWLNRKIGNVEQNMQTERFASAEFWLQGILAGAPTALFLLVPVFALLLKLAYLFTGRLYLEHLVVALYSHVFLLIALALMFVLSALDNWLAPLASWAGVVLDLLFAGVLVWMPLYLLLMQKRVYRQGWWLTALKFFVVGNIYFVMLGIATTVMFLARLAQA